MRIIQISDCHIPGPAEDEYRGTNPRRGLEKVIAAAILWAPDLVLATGDLSEDASPGSYAWLASAFARFRVPVWVTPGNHDEAETLADFFPNTVTGVELVHDGAWQVLLANSAVRKKISGQLSRAQLARLKKLSDPARPKLLALHHQPLAVGSPWIDRYALEEPERLWQTLRDIGNFSVVTWGHVHQAVTLSHEGIAGLCAPSSASNSLPCRERFTPDPEGPACRWFELLDGTQWSTGILTS